MYCRYVGWHFVEVAIMPSAQGPKGEMTKIASVPEMTRNIQNRDKNREAG